MNDDFLIGYALGHLTPEEEAAVELHLQRTPQDAAKVAAYLETLADLVFELEPEPLPQGGEEALLARVRASSAKVTLPPVVVLPVPETREVPSRRSRRASSPGLWSVLAAAAVVALIYLGVRIVPTTDPFLVWQLQRYEGQAGSATYTLAPAEGEQPVGTLVRLSSGRIYVSLERPPEAGRVYQAWDIAEAPVGIGTFGGRSFLSDAAVAEGHTFGVTLEPPGGSEQPTTTPLAVLPIPE